MNKYYIIGPLLIFLALGSSLSVSVAADKLKCKGCVGTKDLANNAVTGAKIKNGSVSINDLSLELQGDIAALGTDIDGLETEPKIKVGLFLPSSQMDRSRGYPEGTLYIRRLTNEIFISRDDATDAAVWELLTSKKYKVGDVGPAGGWVFYITADGLHGLEAAQSDQAIPTISGVAWGCHGTGLTGATGTGIGAGARNTDDIIQSCSESGIATRLAGDYVSPTGYFDWYLPSNDELNLMWSKIGQGSVDNVGGFATSVYWSSSQVDDFNAWGQNFLNGGQFGYVKAGTRGVRAVRAF